MTVGKHAAALERAAAAGRRVGLLRNRPELDLWQSEAWDCFTDCHSCRAPGFNGSGPIPYTSVITWAEVNNVPAGDGLDGLLYLVRELDAAWLEHEEKSSQ